MSSKTEDCEHRKDYLMMTIGPNDWCPYCEVDRLLKINRENERILESDRLVVVQLSQCIMRNVDPDRWPEFVQRLRGEIVSEALGVR